MSQSATKVLVAIGLLAACSLVAIPAVAQKAPSVPQALPVNVENTPNVNVANTPSVSVTNTPSVNVANTPTVTLAPGGSTNVTNPLDGQNNPTPLATLDAIQPYEDSCALGFNGSNVGNCTFHAVPQGKRLVIQEFDAVGFVETGLKPFYVAIITVEDHIFPATFMGSGNGQDSFATHQETRVYAAGSPACTVNLTGGSSIGNWYCAFSGFLVDTH